MQVIDLIMILPLKLVQYLENNELDLILIVNGNMRFLKIHLSKD